MVILQKPSTHLMQSLSNTHDSCTEFKPVILKFTWNYTRLRIAEATVRTKDEAGGITRLYTTPQSYGIQCQEVLVPKETWRTMQKNRDPRNKPIVLLSINLPQWEREYIEFATNFIWIFLYNAMEKLQGTFWPTQHKGTKIISSSSHAGKVIEPHFNHCS